MNVLDVLDEARQIDQSRPEYLVGVAEAWGKISFELESKKTVVTRSFARVSDGWESQGPAVETYGNEVTAGMDQLQAGVNEVSAALGAVAQPLQDLKSKLHTALISVGGTVASLFFLPLAPIAGGASIATITDLVNAYHQVMLDLSFALASAKEKFGTLNSLNSAGGATGGIIPTPLDLPATPE